MKYITRTATTLALCCVSLSAAAIPTFSASLSELNSSGVSGNANLAFDSSTNTLTVNIQASGLEPDKPHPQHIHGVIGGDSVSPTDAADADGDGFVELAEAKPDYGPILIPLTSPPGGATADFPTAPDGTINFSQTYDLSNSATFADDFDSTNLFPLENREIVLHGMTLNEGDGFGDGEADGTAGFKATLPVASGVITSQAVPEPGSLGMLFLGATAIGGLLFARKRYNSDAAST